MEGRRLLAGLRPPQGGPSLSPRQSETLPRGLEARLDGLKSPLFFFVGLQTILVSVLLFKISDLDKRLAAASVAPQTVAAAPVTAAAPAGLTAGDIRAILREELASLETERSDSAPPPAVPSPPRAAETDRAYLDVQQETRRLIAKGAASEAEMAALELQIAELPAEQRRQALSALSRALSNGTLKARL